MKPARVRRLTFEILESKASPSAVLLALAPLEELDQGVIEIERALYTAHTSTAPAASISATGIVNTALLQFIEHNTRRTTEDLASPGVPAAARAALADTMMQATDADLRAMLISETLDEDSPDAACI